MKLHKQKGRATGGLARAVMRRDGGGGRGGCSGGVEVGLHGAETVLLLAGDLSRLEESLLRKPLKPGAEKLDEPLHTFPVEPRGDGRGNHVSQHSGLTTETELLGHDIGLGPEGPQQLFRYDDRMRGRHEMSPFVASARRTTWVIAPAPLLTQK